MNVKEIMLKRESLYSEHACFSEDAVRILTQEEDIRPAFFRDIDRIIHCSSYTRYMNKTQVFTSSKNDHISTRMTHVQLVSKIARTIGRALSLNEDLIEAIALGHDLGHTPYGHEGEKILNEISLKNGEGPFMHNVQSVRNLMIIENKNICIQVLDGILCHNGEFLMNEYYPKKKSMGDFLNDYESCYLNASHGKKLVPMTLEGCVVRISDIIGYIGRDIEDAVALGVFDIKALPFDITSTIGNSNKNIVNNIILDIINNSLGKPYIKLSDKMYNAIKKLKDFNYENIYYKAISKKHLKECEIMFETMFSKLKNILDEKDLNQNIYTNFLNKMSDEYKSSNTNSRVVIDYIAGMTDDYFLSEYKNLSSSN